MKKLFTLLLVVVLCLALVLGTYATSPYIFDQADLLTEEQWDKLNSIYESVEEETGVLVRAVSTTSLEGKDAQTYTGDFFDAHFSGDGILLMLCLDEGYWWITTNDWCADVFPESRTDEIGAAVADYIRNGQYVEGFACFAEEVRVSMLDTSTDTETIGQTVPETGFRMKDLVKCLGIGLIIGLVVVGIMAAQMRSVRTKSSACDYVKQGSLQITQSRDIFLYQTRSRRAKPQNNSSGTRSSGRSGGGSRGGSGGRL